MFSKKVIIRACVGCILPKRAKLIGTGDYTIIINNSKRTDQYYDYMINEEYLDKFLEENRGLLLRNNLLEEDE